MQMTEREQAIATAYEAFRAIRRLPADQICAAWVNASLQAGGGAPMTPDEARLVDAHIRCTWDAWQGSGPARIPQFAEFHDFDRLPDAMATTTTAADGCRGRATLWD
jgi:hypothetical protein